MPGAPRPAYSASIAVFGGRFLPTAASVSSDTGAAFLGIATMRMHADQSHGAYDADESAALQRIYAIALDALGDRVAVDGEMERRLAVIVLLAFAAEAPGPEAEDGVARGCVDRLMARCAMA